MLQSLSQFIETATGLNPDLQSRLLGSALVFLLIWLFQRLARAILTGRIKDVKNLYYWNKVSSYIIASIGLIVVGRIWFAGVAALATFFGLLSAGLAIAFRDPLVNLAGWSFILWRRPFRVGDRIEIGTHRGDVIDQSLFNFSLMEIGHWVDAEQSSGRVVLIPNGKVFSETMANYYLGFHYTWLELPVLVTFESNWQRAKQIMTHIAEEKTVHLSKIAQKRLREASQKRMIFYNKLTPVVYTEVRDSGVLLTIRCLCEPRRERVNKEVLWEAILTSFAECDDIDFAYPSQRVYFNAMEGKSGARASLALPQELSAELSAGVGADTD